MEVGADGEGILDWGELGTLFKAGVSVVKPDHPESLVESHWRALPNPPLPHCPRHTEWAEHSHARRCVKCHADGEATSAPAFRRTEPQEAQTEEGSLQ